MSQFIDRSVVTQALEELQPLLSGDGGSLDLVEIDDAKSLISLRVNFSADAACEQCVVEPIMLQEIVAEVFRNHIPGLGGVVVDDPRMAS
jgi:Fe-S cluster biogenesis protein NfuA